MHDTISRTLKFHQEANRRKAAFSEAREQLSTRKMSHKMQDITPYTERPKTEIERERLCKTFVFEGMPPVKTIFDALGGIGLSGQILADAQPKAKLIATDLDETCVQQYNARLNGRATARQGNAFNFVVTWDDPDWACSVDFNKFTLLNMLDTVNWQTILLDEIVARQPKWIHFGDTAMKYLHLNWKSYGIPNAKFETYLDKLDATYQQIWGYRIARVARHTGAAQMVLLPSQRASAWKAKTIGDIHYHWRTGAAPKHGES